MPNTPNPGSPEAIKQGCKCPRMDNANGCGIPWPGEANPLFYISELCPIHGQEKEPQHD